jgi:hypothetical protein
MRTAKLKMTALILTATGLVGLGAVGTGYALTQIPAPRTAGEPPPKPEPPAKREPQPPPKMPNTPDTHFTAFPELKPFDPNKDKNWEEKLLERCPRLYGDAPPPVERGDDTYRRLLKAQLQQGRLEVQRVYGVIKIGQWDAAYYCQYTRCLTDMRTVAVELWGNDPKTLIPWLEEFVIVEKETERFISALVEAGRNRPHDLHTARRHRMAAEAALWKAKQRS